MFVCFLVWFFFLNLNYIGKTKITLKSDCQYYTRKEHYFLRFSVGLFPNKYLINVSTLFSFVMYIYTSDANGIHFQMDTNCIIYEYNLSMFFIEPYLVCNS